MAKDFKTGRIDSKPIVAFGKRPEGYFPKTK